MYPPQDPYPPAQYADELQDEEYTEEELGKLEGDADAEEKLPFQSDRARFYANPTYTPKVDPLRDSREQKLEQMDWQRVQAQDMRWRKMNEPRDHWRPPAYDEAQKRRDEK